MSSLRDLELLDDFDALQRYSTREDVIANAKELMIEHSLDPSFSRYYLCSIIFFKFQSEFPDMTDGFKDVTQKLHDKIELETNVPKFIELFNIWKKEDVATTLDNLNMMKRHTRASSSDTDDKDCKRCLLQQEAILSIAENFYKSMQKED